MATFLLAWNPNNWTWHDLPDMVDRVRRQGTATRRRRCGAHRQVRLGDRVCLIRLGREPNGILGAGGYRVAEVKAIIDPMTAER